MDSKICKGCKQDLPTTSFNSHKSGKNKGNLMSYCKDCDRKRVNEWRHKTGKNKPIDQACNTGAYLGVHIVESVLVEIFNSAIRSKPNTIGYDFVCGKGFKVDAKSSCKGGSRNAIKWTFHIEKNKIADYFICLALDSRNNLTPLHIWIIPGKIVNHLQALVISEGSLDKWVAYERPLLSEISERIKDISGDP